MSFADEAIVYFNPEVVKHKKLESISKDLVFNSFGGNVKVMTNKSEVLEFINQSKWNHSVLLMMSSGNFDGLNYDQLALDIVSEL